MDFLFNFSPYYTNTMDSVFKSKRTNKPELFGLMNRVNFMWEV